MKSCLIVGIILLSLNAAAQDTSKSAQDTAKHSANIDDRVYTKVEIEAEYPGGPPAWNRFLAKNLHYPEAAISNEIQGTIIVQFIVDTAGNISDIKATSGPITGGLREEGVRVVSLSKKWMPAIQNGFKVRSYKRLTIPFKLRVN